MHALGNAERPCNAPTAAPTIAPIVSLCQGEPRFGSGIDIHLGFNRQPVTGHLKFPSFWPTIFPSLLS